MFFKCYAKNFFDFFFNWGFPSNRWLFEFRMIYSNPFNFYVHLEMLPRQTCETLMLWLFLVLWVFRILRFRIINTALLNFFPHSVRKMLTTILRMFISYVIGCQFMKLTKMSAYTFINFQVCFELFNFYSFALY